MIDLATGDNLGADVDYQAIAIRPEHPTPDGLWYLGVPTPTMAYVISAKCIKKTKTQSSLSNQENRSTSLRVLCNSFKTPCSAVRWAHV